MTGSHKSNFFDDASKMTQAQAQARRRRKSIHPYQGLSITIINSMQKFIVPFTMARIISSRSFVVVVIVIVTFLSTALQISAFGSFGKKSVGSASKTKLPLPTLNKDTGRYEKSPLDDGKYPYDAIGSALRHGPSPFLTRVFNADEYEQGVLKYMLTAQVDRAEATGNIDAKLNNVLDWQYQKMEEKKGKPKVDYTRLDKKQAALTVIWALGITPLAVSVVVDTANQFMNSPGPSVIKGL